MHLELHRHIFTLAPTDFRRDISSHLLQSM
jgi:hypothetical protein